MGFISKMTTWWSIRWRNKRALRIMSLMSSLTNDRTRLQFSLPRHGKDKAVDLSIRHAWKFFTLNGPGAYADAKTELSDQGFEIYRWFCNDARAKKDGEMFFRHMLLHFHLTKQEKAASFFDFMYRMRYKKAPAAVRVSALRKRPFVLLKRLRIASQAHYNTQIRLLSFEFEHFAQIASVLSVVFVVSGYLYTKIVYGYFGISASRFFALGDYLAGSIDQIGLALVAFSIYLVTVIPLYRARGQFRIEFLFKYFDTFPLRVIILLSIPFAFVGILWLAYMHAWHVFWLLAPLSVFFLFQILVARMVAQVFKNPFHMTAAVMLALIFFASIFLQSVKQIVSVETDREQTTFVVQTNQKTFTNEEFVFLGGNERYIFLRQEGGGADIIPRENIQNMSMPDLKTWSIRLTLWYQRLPFFWRDFPGKTGAE